MGFKKFQKVESSAPLSADEHIRLYEELRRAKKSSARHMTDDERQKLADLLDKAS